MSRAGIPDLFLLLEVNLYTASDINMIFNVTHTRTVLGTPTVRRLLVTKSSFSYSDCGLWAQKSILSTTKLSIFEYLVYIVYLAKKLTSTLYTC